MRVKGGTNRSSDIHRPKAQLASALAAFISFHAAFAPYKYHPQTVGCPHPLACPSHIYLFFIMLTAYFSSLLQRLLALLRCLTSNAFYRPRWLGLNFTDPPDLYRSRPGKVLHGKYTVRCQLGNGVYSTTFLANDQSTA